MQRLLCSPMIATGRLLATQQLTSLRAFVVSSPCRLLHACNKHVRAAGAVGLVGGPQSSTNRSSTGGPQRRNSEGRHPQPAARPGRSRAAAPRALPQRQQRAGFGHLVSNTTSMLRNLQNGGEVFLVGTAHVSRASADEVRDVIRAVRPDAVMVELDPGRAERLRRGNTQGDFLKEVLKGLGGGGLGGGQFDLRKTLVQLGMGGMYQALKAFGMEPGAEFRVAMEEAERLGARIIYGDQDVQRTLSNVSRGLDLPRLMRLMTSSPDGLDAAFRGGAGLEDSVEALKTRAAASKMVAHLREVAPELAAALVDERDKHMCDVLLQQRGRVVAVVGLAHLDGIERRWQTAQAAGPGSVASLPPLAGGGTSGSG